MENSIPMDLERDLDYLGILPRNLQPMKFTPNFDRKEAMQKKFFRRPKFDQWGEPEF